MTKQSNRSIRPVTLSIVVIAIANVVLGLTYSLNNEFAHATKWGVYAGEYLVLVTWMAMGAGTFFNRVFTVAIVGILWMAASWLGLSVWNLARAFSYRHEMLYMLTVVPLAFAVSCIPLIALRKLGGWRMENMPVLLRNLPKSRAFILLVFTGFGISLLLAYGMYPKFIRSDIKLALLIGFILGIIAFAICPLVVGAVLRERIYTSLLLVALLLVLVLAPGTASFFAIPGGGGSPVYVYAEAAVMGLFALLTHVSFALIWRASGCRLLRAAAMKSSL